MAVAVGRGFLVPPCALSPNNKSSFGITNTPSPAKQGTTRAYTRLVARAQLRPTWLPGLDPPPYLDGR